MERRNARIEKRSLSVTGNKRSKREISGRSRNK